MKTRSKTRTILFLAFLMIATLFLGACAGGDDEVEATSTPITQLSEADQVATLVANADAAEDEDADEEMTVVDQANATLTAQASDSGPALPTATATITLPTATAKITLPTATATVTLPTATATSIPSVDIVSTEEEREGAVWGPINNVWFYDQPVPFIIFNQIMEDSDSVSDALVNINAAMMINQTSAIGGEWGKDEAVAGLTLVGPKAFWTDILNEGDPLPECFHPKWVQGEWGVYLLPEGCEFTFPEKNGGGRWITIVGERDTFNPIANDVLAAASPEAAIEVAIEAWNDDWSLDFEDGGTLTLKEGEFAIVWTDWGNSPPPEAFVLNAEPGSGYGVFVLAGENTWEIPSGGVHVFHFTD